MVYKFNRKTYLTPEDLVLAFVENLDSLEMAKLHLKDIYIDLWLTEIKDYDILIFIKKLKEDYLDDYELIIFELVYYLNPRIQFKLFQYPNIEIESLEDIIKEEILFQKKEPELSYIFSNLYNGRLNIYYKVYHKHTKKNHLRTNEFFEFVARSTFFKTILPENFYKEYNLKALLKVIDVYLKPNIYNFYKSYFIDSVPFIPTFDEISILYKFFPDDLKKLINVLENLKLKVDEYPLTMEESIVKSEVRLGRPRNFVQNFLIDIISRRVTNFDVDNWVTKLNRYLIDNDFYFGDKILQGRYIKFSLNGKWGVINANNFTLVLNNLYLDIIDFLGPNNAKYFLGKIADNEWAILDQNSKLLGYNYSSKLSIGNLILKVFESGGKTFTGIFNHNNQRLYPFDEVYQFYEGIAITKTEGKYNFISYEGKILLNIPVDDARNFKFGFAAIKENNKWGFINLLGEELNVVEFMYNSGKVPEKINNVVFDQNLGTFKSRKNNSIIDRIIVGTEKATIFDDVSMDIQVEVKELSTSSYIKKLGTVEINSTLYSIELYDLLSIIKKPAITINNNRIKAPLKLNNSAAYNRNLSPNGSSININGYTLEKEWNHYFLKKNNNIFFPKF